MPSNSADPRQQAAAIARGLFPHQVEGVAFLLKRQRAILADDMGLGKTRQTIVALRQNAPEGPYLVVCPASVKRNWVREIEAVDPDCQTAIIGPEPPPKAGWKGWVIVNYDLLKRHIDTLEAFSWKGMVFDEAHYLKNHTSQRSRFGRRLVAGCSEDVPIYALTGTPLTNRPRDLFPLLQMVRHPLARSFMSFAKRYCDAYHNGYGWVTDGASNLDELSLELRAVMLRRAKEEVLDLPPKMRTWLNVEVPPSTGMAETRQALAGLLAARQAEASGRPRSGDDRARLLGMLSRARRKIATAKVKTTIEYIENALAQGEKVLVFSGFDAPLKKIQAHFGKQCLLLTGATPTGKRQGLVDRFQLDDDIGVFAANIVAGGIGLNLTAARQVVFNDLDWVPANHWQAEDRAYRIGQTGAVQVTYMVGGGTIDEFVYQALQAKAALVEGVVEGKALDATAGADIFSELEQLMGALSPGLADTHSGGDRLDEDQVQSILEQARQLYAERHSVQPEDFSRDTLPQISDKALEVLINVLEKPESKSYRVSSNSKPGAYYEIAEQDGELHCSCRGFEYRGTCSHVRTLQAALAEGEALPDGIEAVAATK